MDVLGIDVPRAQLLTWRDWLMPAPEQPYVLPEGVARDLGVAPQPARLTLDVTDAFWLYGVGDRTYWLTRAQARALPAEVKADQPAPHRWPTTDVDKDLARVRRVVEDGVRPSRHAEVPDAVWDGCADRLPGARALAGTFPTGSGPNCFGTSMGAAGAADAVSRRVEQPEFEQWLARAARGRLHGRGTDDEPGTVLVWRMADGTAIHSAVTIGGGYALHKPSQGWMSPRMVLTTPEVISAARVVGAHLHRYRLAASAS